MLLRMSDIYVFECVLLRLDYKKEKKKSELVWLISCAMINCALKKEFDSDENIINSK